MRKLVGLSLIFLMAATVGCRKEESCFAQCDEKDCVLCNEEGCWPLRADRRPVASPYLECTAYCDSQGCVVCDHGDCVRVSLHPPTSGASGGDPVTSDDPALSNDDPNTVSDDVDVDPGCSGSCGGDPDPTLLCHGDDQCGGGRCLFDRCHAPCLADTACGTGDVCQEGLCVHDLTPEPTCLFDEECGGANACIDGTCYAACASDAECENPADFCDRGLCRPDWRAVAECTVSADCDAGEECADGECRTPCWTDPDCAACSDGPHCVAGYCGP